MSSDQLINFTKNTKTTSSDVGSTKKSESVEKKEGPSLFDSLMNQAKTDKTSAEAKTDSIKNTENNSNSISKITLGNETEEKKNNSLKKMVEKLVDIVVNAAKDIFDKTSGKKLNTEDLKNTVENLVDKKIESLENTDDIKKLLNKKLDIVTNSVNIIKNEIKEKSVNSISETVDLSKIVEHISKKVIDDEIDVIKNNVKDIKKDIGLIDNSKLSISEKKEINTEVKNSLETIDESSDEIATIISKVENKKTIENAESKTSIKKVEYKLETISDAVTNIKEKISEIIIVKTTESTRNSESKTIIKSNLSSEISDEDPKKPLLASMFLNAQKTAKTNNSLEQLKDAKSNIIEKKSVESIKNSAEKLELNLDETEVKHESEEGKKPISSEKKDELKSNNLINNRSLNRVLINQKIEQHHINKEQESAMIQKNSLISSDNEKKSIESVEMAVPKEIIPSLQNKIIGAQQKMGSFMSEVARNMYLNYKPPVTAFRVNLNPANLGSISIIMKANKIDNSLTVSMNLSNSNTMEAFSDNKVALQNAIQRQFTETSSVSINFNMNEQDSQSQFDQFNDNNKKDQQNNNEKDQNNDESNIMDEQEIIETNDYM